MTNTRITDPEILEQRYPVLLHCFALNKGSGGLGQWKGGDGVIREIEFLMNDIQVSILSERRVFAPYGMNGGGSGACGKNTWIRDGIEMNLGGKNSFRAQSGDRIRIVTPGGGGYGIHSMNKK